MPMTPQGARTFLHALSDFWVLYFQDMKVLDAYAEGIALNTAQLYQTFLETVLGSSLADAPLFDRTFYAPYALREDAIRYIEGEGPDQDRWRVATGDALRGADYLVNRIIAPTAFLRQGREFEVTPGAFDFRGEPFEALANFPVRFITVVSPGAWRDPLGRGWDGVRPGDAFVLQIGGAQAEAVVTGTDGPVIHLDSAPVLLSQSLVRRGGRVTILRTPWDRQVVGRLLPDHPEYSERLSTGANDGMTVIGGNEVSILGLSGYRGSWTISTAYAVGDLVFRSGRAWRCLEAHTSGGSFDPAPWDDLSLGYVYMTHVDDPSRDGLYPLGTPSMAGRVRLTGAADFTQTGSVLLQRVRYQGITSGPVNLRLGHEFIDPGLVISSRREVARRVRQDDGSYVTHPAGEAVEEGVDWSLDAEAGHVRVLSAWSPGVPARASYTWRLLVAKTGLPWKGALAAGPYSRGDLLSYAGEPYVVREDHTSGGSFDPALYAPFVPPAALDAERVVREAAVWATDALVDTGRLYANFGALLAPERDSSEVYRAFLTAVSRLFLFGPTLERFESALNAVAGLPLVREDGEVLLSYSSGVDESEGDSAVYGTAMGQNGSLDAASGTFESPTAGLFPNDVGAVIEVREGGRLERYTVTGVVSATTALVTPVPTADAEHLPWSYDHVAMKNRLRLAGNGYRFTDEDIGAWVRVTSTGNPRNVGTFRVLSIDDPLTAELESEYGFVDAAPVAWDLSRSGEQVVGTSRREYRVPLNVPLRQDLSVGQSLRAFTPLSTAFVAVDYLEDPSWWHRVTIPQELLGDGAGPRTVSPELIENVYGALDGASFGDPGFYYGADETGRPGTERKGEAVWYGAHEVVLGFGPGVPVARGRDVGEYLVVHTEGFRGCFEITSVSQDGKRLGLDRFPPPEAHGAVPPQSITVELPPLVYRRTVGLVLMDRTLKYHSVRIEVDPSVGLTRTFLEDTLRIISTSKPTHVFLFFDAITSFVDRAEVEEALTIAIDYALLDQIQAGDATALAAVAPLRAGDAYRFVARTASISSAPGTYALPTTLPSGTSPERTLVKVRFDPAARVGARLPTEGVDYDVDYAGGTVTIRAGVTLTPTPVTVSYLDCIRRQLAPSDPHDPGEVDWLAGGADPTFVRPPGAPVSAAAIVDRAIQITLGP